MNIGRDKKIQNAMDKIGYCLDKLEDADQFTEDVINSAAHQKQVDREDLERRFGELAGWQFEVVEDLTIEEMVGALIAAERELREIDEIKESREG